MEAKQRAAALFEQAYERQRHGELERAAELYRASISLHPTAEAHTFLGWTYSIMGRLEDAIEECHKAIATDPTLGNPYNDIGAYLLELERPEEAIPWLRRALEAPRYEAPHFAHCNLGRAYEELGCWDRARRAYRAALDLQPGYPPARQAWVHLIARSN